MKGKEVPKNRVYVVVRFDRNPSDSVLAVFATYNKASLFAGSVGGYVKEMVLRDD